MVHVTQQAFAYAGGVAESRLVLRVSQKGLWQHDGIGTFRSQSQASGLSIQLLLLFGKRHAKGLVLRRKPSVIRL